MPNAINPNDYNIDKLNTGFLGPILTTDFRDYILNHNLHNYNPQVIAGGYNVGGVNVYAPNSFLNSPNVQDQPDVMLVSTTPNIYGVSPQSNNLMMNLWSSIQPYQYTIGNNIYQSIPGETNDDVANLRTTLPLTNPGDVNTWRTGLGSQTADNYRENIINSRRQYSENSYGPEYIVSYNSPNFSPEKTGFVQYKSTVGGDFRSGILGQQLGFGIASGIDYPSDLEDIGSEQRKFNLAERIKLNFIGDTIGRINLDPFGLLAGQDLITKDYSITKPPSFAGKAADFAASLVGFNLPTSILRTWKSVPGLTGPDINQELLDYTGAGTKSLLYDAILQNKWGPKFQRGQQKTEPETKVGKFFKSVSNALDNFGGAGDQPATISYTDPVETDVVQDITRDKSIVDKLNTGLKNKVDGLFRKVVEQPSIPNEFEQPSTPSNPIDGDEAYGFNKGYSIEPDTISQQYYDIDNYGTKSRRVITKSDKNIGSEAPLPSDGTSFFWEKRTTGNPFKRGLLKYTQSIINMTDYNTNSSARFIGIVNSDENISIERNNRHKVFSQGNRIKSDDNEVFCRSWSIRNSYSKYEDLIRNSKLIQKDRFDFKDLSVLEEIGMPKIAPYSDEFNNWKESLFSEKKPSKYMLSIENLAWQNTREFTQLSNLEKGPNGGRIMWFPPYDISFTDNSSVSWDSTSFIGRGEPIYTYNHTERTGTLDFTVIMDHPSALNILRNEVSGTLEKYFAGCRDLEDISTLMGIEVEDTGDVEEQKPPTPLNEPQKPPFDSMDFYFQNADSLEDPGRSVYFDLGQDYEIDGLNQFFETTIDTLVEFLISEDGKRYKISVEGYASSLAKKGYNKKLGLDRATSLRQYLLDKMIEKETEVGEIKYPVVVDGQDKFFPNEITWQSDGKRWSQPISFGEDVSKSTENVNPDGTYKVPNPTPEEKEVIINDPVAKSERKGVIRLTWNPDIDESMGSLSSSEIEEINKQNKTKENRREELNKQLANDKAKQLVNEATYFKKLSQTDPFLYESIKEKVEFFHPAFHSMTPEGFNTRLTFLKQCTRQGPNIGENEPNNMAFGKPPICILRIGDFYHTKIVIDTVNFNFDPMQWDLNPEGVGVQPMICKVNLSFKFIGGSSLGGPITQLQNAVAFNFFANTSVYEGRRSVPATTTVVDGKNINQPEFEYGSFVEPGQTVKSFGDFDVTNNVETTESDINNTVGVDGVEKPITESEKEQIKENDEGKKGDDLVKEDLKRINLTSSSLDNNGLTYTISKVNEGDEEVLSIDYPTIITVIETDPSDSVYRREYTLTGTETEIKAVTFPQEFTYDNDELELEYNESYNYRLTIGVKANDKIQKEFNSSL